ncbi:hypothetical protein [Mammaliicoccus sp. D-M17]|uniref:hypothetical protein n=1 Tax=Mammaliicoccus sp. D-M17 TaxID=2898677 RepID=UPI001EFA4E98|nr:hypothetical protein [Mammaliicoccus sp. D-M17]
MTGKQKVGILILLIVVIFIVGVFVPNQFNDDYIIKKNKESIGQDKKELEQKKAEEQAKQDKINNLPENLDNNTFNKRFSEQAEKGEEFLSKYYEYRYLDKNKSFDESLSYLSENAKADMNTTNDIPLNLIERNATIKGVKPLQDDSDENKVSFEYTVKIKEVSANASIDDKKVKKDDKYLKDIKTSTNESDRTIVLTIDVNTKKIESVISNYL